jgi:sugar-specific transcriptional regulator TrmB
VRNVLGDVSDTDIDCLCKLGLTALQAKIYLLLYETGKNKIQTIARIANVDRANTYQILGQLQGRGLVERIVEMPTLYRAVSMQEATTTLLAQKEHEYEKIMDASKELLREHAEYEKKLLDLNPQISLVSYDGSVANKSIESAWANVQRIGELYLEEFLFAEVKEWPWVTNMWKKAMNRGVRVRVITKRLQEEDSCISNALMSLKANTNFEIRYTTSPIICQFICLDEQEAWFLIDKVNIFEKYEGIKLKHKGIGKLAHTYFEMLWDETPP